MSDFEGFSEEIENGMEFLEHHGILGQRWGKLNGPPYPLGVGDHSGGEKKAAAEAGIKVGSDSGKGSIENVKKKKSNAGVQNKPKKELTPEEKREAALAAARSGDKKKIAKYMDYLTTQELQEAETRARVKSGMTREEPGEKKASKAELEKQDAIRSGDKEKIKQYADKMSNSELQEALNRVDLNAKLNYVKPSPTAMDKLKTFATKVDDFRQVAEKGVNAYNLAAKVYNSTHKDGTKWPIIGDQKKDNEKSKEEKIAENLLKQVTNDVSKNMQQTQNQKKQENNQSQQNQQPKQQPAPQPKQEEDITTRSYNEAYNKVKNSRLSDFDDVPSYEDLITDDVRDVWSRKVS